MHAAAGLLPFGKHTFASVTIGSPMAGWCVCSQPAWLAPQRPEPGDSDGMRVPAGISNRNQAAVDTLEASAIGEVLMPAGGEGPPW